jgi:hypothetical protein
MWTPPPSILPRPRLPLRLSALPATPLQGMFVNFRRLYDYNNGKMPMGVAQVRAC